MSIIYKTRKKISEILRNLIRILIVLPVAVILTNCGGSGGSGGSSSSPLTPIHWSATWYGAPQYYAVDPLGSNPAKSFGDQTFRQQMYISQGGTSLRLKVSNLFGTSPLVLKSMHIAKSAGSYFIISSTDVAVSFNGQASVTVPVGQELYSDTVNFSVEPLSTLAVSTYVASASALETTHYLGVQKNYVASGNVVSSSNIIPTETNTFYTWITGIDVKNSSIDKVIVAFGDSITDGYGSTDDQNNRYPNFLSRTLIGSGVAASVINSGISGNRWLNDGTGPNGVGRFSRDVLDVSGATHVIALLGINDIGVPASHGRPTEIVTSDQLITAITNAASAAHAKRIKFYAGTLMPMAGTIFTGYYSESNEAMRQAVNSFIRTTNVVDGFIDFDAVVRDPLNPTYILTAYRSDDGLHPTDAGYAAMGEAAAAVLRKSF